MTLCHLYIEQLNIILEYTINYFKVY
jgi:hypothetical protein